MFQNQNTIRTTREVLSSGRFY